MILADTSSGLECKSRRTRSRLTNYGDKGAALNLQEFAKLLRARWITVCAAIVICILGAIATTLLTTPLYQSSTRLFVSTSSGVSVAENYQGNRLSQERVLSYTELLTGETLAQRTIDKLGLSMSAQALQSEVKASAKPDTVLIDVAVLDESPVQARDIANTLADEFVGMVRELETPENGARPDARVVVEQKASVPSKPVVPKPTRNIAIGLGLGVLLGIGLAFLRDKLDNTVKSQETVEQITAAGLVGSIPLDKDRRKEPAITFENNNSPIAEAFRKLRTNLQFLAVDNPPRVIVVTSSVPNEGKSTTATNIALALAEAGNEVVLVDGDMRRPMLDKYLNLVGSVGLSTALIGQASLTDVLQETAFPRLTVLTSGTVPPNPSELLGTMAAKKVLDELRSKFDYVIVDSSPLLAVTDAAILASNADGVIVITRFGFCKREQLAHAVGNLTDVGASVLGAALVMTPIRGNSPYNYGYYGYYGEGSASTSTSRASQAKNHKSADHAENSPTS